MGREYDEKYFGELLKSEIKLLFVGQDPYPKKQGNGIPFSKKDWDGINASGKNLLKGLGFIKEEEVKKGKPNDFFYRLLKDKRIGVANASYFLIGSNKLKDFEEEIRESEIINEPIFLKAKKIITTKGAIDVLKHYKNYKNYNFEIVLHPTNRNRSRSGFQEIWQEKGGLLRKFELE